jgi:3-deoxy-manno-octulosonate cytidylyltransferase (CMP-KDO synthetase)
MNIIGVIPARYKSSRFEGKPLALIDGLPMIWHVYRAASNSSNLSSVVVATDDQRIAEVCSYYNMNYTITSESHKTGTDRVAEVAMKIQADIYVNIQGDEPLIEPSTIDAALTPFFLDEDVKVTNLMTKIKDSVDVVNFTVPKVLTTREGIGIYLTRSPCPYPKGKLDYDYYKQVCVYGFTREALLDFAKLPRGKLEEIEDIEILRFIENGYKVKYIEVASNTIAVDTPNDLQKVIEVFKGKNK